MLLDLVLLRQVRDIMKGNEQKKKEKKDNKEMDPLYEIECVCLYLRTFNYVISRSEDLQECNYGRFTDSVSCGGRLYITYVTQKLPIA